MKFRDLIACGTLLVSACGKTSAPVAERRPTTKRAHDTSELWAFAPASTTYGAVVADGVLVNIQTLLADQIKKLQGNAWATPLLDEIAAKRTPVDMLDPAAVEQQTGGDPSRGYGIFSDGGPIPLIVLSVTDRAKYRAFRGTSTIEVVGGREFDRFKTRVCTLEGRYYVCGVTIEKVTESITAHASAIATAVNALPNEARGDVEFYVDVARTPMAAEIAAKGSGTLGTVTAGGVALRFEKDGATVHVWGTGAMTGTLVPMLASRPPSSNLVTMSGGAASVLRLPLNRELLAMIGAPSATLDNLTGDVQLVSAGTGLVGAALVAEVKEGANPTATVVGLCNTLKNAGLAGLQDLQVTATGCTGNLTFAWLKEQVGFDLPAAKLAAIARGRVVVVTVGAVDPVALTGSAGEDAASPAAKTAVTGPASVALWTRGLDIDLSALPASMIKAVMADPWTGMVFRVITWVLAQVYEISASTQLTRDGVGLTLRLTTFAGDPPTARAAYEAAVDKRFADRAAYETDTIALEKQFASSLVARRARLERSTPVVGAFLPLLAGFVILAGKRAAEDSGVDADGFLKPLPLP